MKNMYGLIGCNISYSFSKKYFTDKFKREGLDSHQYDVYDLVSLDQLPDVFSVEGLRGLNVTIPYKEQIISHIDHVVDYAAVVGAVNTLKVNNDGSITGYNTDVIGFEKSLFRFLDNKVLSSALILGSGGVAKAVKYVLEKMGFSTITMVSRQPSSGDVLSYEDLTGRLKEFSLIVNCTPLGTFPHVEQYPPIPLDELSSFHYVYDLVYNPQQTALMKAVQLAGGRAYNGLEMLHLQAEAAWEIWNQ